MKEQKINFPINPYGGQVYYDRKNAKSFEWFPYSNKPNDGIWMEIDWNHKRLP
tara:strand:+ start:223 stop:381 length:159 start_codon:yes stop_codon:yes gene_type:complete